VKSGKVGVINRRRNALQTSSDAVYKDFLLPGIGCKGEIKIMHKSIEFYRNDDHIRQMAIYIAQLEKEGVEYRIDASMDKFIVEVTGH
jgi:hypothetical protein